MRFRSFEISVVLHFVVPNFDRVLHYLPRQVKFYSLNFHVTDIKRLFNAINCYINLKGVFLLNTWASQQDKYLKHGGREPVARKKNDAGTSCPKLSDKNEEKNYLICFL